MKLSDAISLGATLRPQGTGFLYNAENNTTCASGGALEAMGVDIISATPEALWGRFDDLWPWTTTMQVKCPIEGCRLINMTVSQMIPHLNDNPCCWTREQIAAWVATMEPPDEQPCDTSEVATAQQETPVAVPV